MGAWQLGGSGVSRRNLLKGAALSGAGLAAQWGAQVVGAAESPDAMTNAQQGPEYSIWVLEYANAPQFPVSGMLYGAHNRGTTRVPFVYVIIKGMNTVALFDVGFRAVEHGARFAEAFGVVDAEAPDVVLARIGLSPADVQHIFIGHAHWDHMGNLRAWPNAHVYVQEREITSWMNALQVPRQLSWISSAADPADLMDATQLAIAGRLTLVQGEVLDVLPGISIHPAHDTHTFGTQYISIKAGAETWVCAGDAVYWYANVEGAPQYGAESGVFVPLGYGQGNQVTQLEAMNEMMQRVGGNSSRIIPGHDPTIFQRFPSRLFGRNSVAELRLVPGEQSRMASAAVQVPK
jgi:glyoxylase-like metal-dependent hydrolase (beta-lactamase superfamily II)